MRGGSLFTPVTLQSPTVSADAYGQRVAASVWTTAAEVMASVAPLMGRELESARQLRPTVTHRVRFRYDPSLPITGGWRILLPGATNRYLYVLAAWNVDERKQETVADCVERLDGSTN